MAVSSNPRIPQTSRPVPTQTQSLPKAAAAPEKNRPEATDAVQLSAELRDSRKSRQRVPDLKSAFGWGETDAQPEGKTDRKAEYREPSEADWHPPTQESERTPEVVARQNQSVEKALQEQKPVDFTTSEGQTVQVQVQKTDTGYRYEFQGKKVEVSFEDGREEDPKADLAQLIDYHAQSPEYAQDSIQAVRFAARPAGSNTDASYRYGSKTITFFGREALDEANFKHELGHAVSDKLTGGWNQVPSGWSEAVRKDGREVSTYGKSSAEENLKTWGGWLNSKIRPGSERADDFAEAYSAYAEARESGPEALQRFRELYPERARLLDPVFA